jgi:hypothetical protein
MDPPDREAGARAGGGVRPGRVQEARLPPLQALSPTPGAAP